MSRTRSVSLCAIIAGLGVAASSAHAEGMLPNGAELTFERLFINEDGTKQIPSTPDAARRYFNLAHCVCASANAGDEQEVDWEMKLSVATGTHRPAALY